MVKNVKIKGVKSLEVVTVDDTYYAIVDVEFSNAGKEGIKLHDGAVTVLFDVKGGVVEKIVPTWKEKTEAKIKSGEKNTKVEVKTYERVLKKSNMVKLGTIKLGENVVPLEVASFADLANSAIKIEGTQTAGDPKVTQQDLYVEIGKKDDIRTLEKIKDIANITGNPETGAVMRLKITSKTALVIDETELDDGLKRTLTLSMTPSVPRDYLMK